MKVELTQQTLVDLLRYEDGKLYWKNRDQKYFDKEWQAVRWNKRYAEKEAFTYSSYGYKQGRIFDKGYLAHRVIYCMFYGAWPSEIDHIDGNPTNNRIENLREVTSSENSKNMKMHAHNTSGIVGVYFERYTNCWCASIESETKRYKKRFKDKLDAISWRQDKEMKLGFHKNHGRNK
jgi:hypothetical protein